MLRKVSDVCEECGDEADSNVRLCTITDRDNGYAQEAWLCRFCFAQIDGTQKIDSRKWHGAEDEDDGESQNVVLWDLGAIDPLHPFAA